MIGFLKGAALGMAIGASLMILGGATTSHQLGRIIHHESRNNPNAVGDQGRSLGLAQISYPYYVDSRKTMAKYGITPPPYHEAVKSRYWSEQLIRFYMIRYVPKAWAAGDLQTIARIHNGGLNGLKKPATERYWIQIKNSK